MRPVCPRRLALVSAGLAAPMVYLLAPTLAPPEAAGGAATANGIVVFAWNDLGMHCMNEDFSELVILPPFNNINAQVLHRGAEPDIMTGDVTITYRIPSNTHSADKTNFWEYAPQIFGVSLPPDVGLTGHGLAGTMTLIPGQNYYEVTGVPLTSTDDNGRENPYPIARIVATSNDGDVSVASPVIPVSTEISCNLCHHPADASVGVDILRAHDQLHGTSLEFEQPVLCAGCHADPALGTPGVPGLPSLSAAMHTAHAPRMDMVGLENDCYACHPGIRTNCQRDLHYTNGVTCTECHGGMEAVGNPARTPWVDLPRCGDCHSRPGFQFEQAGALFKTSRGHGGVRCSACHGSPHVITPATTEADNVQAMSRQGHTGVINDCLVCHTVMPGESFFHSVEH